jgi:hypothetical protein
MVAMPTPTMKRHSMTNRRMTTRPRPFSKTKTMTMTMSLTTIRVITATTNLAEAQRLTAVMNEPITAPMNEAMPTMKGLTTDD